MIAALATPPRAKRLGVRDPHARSTRQAARSISATARSTGPSRSIGTGQHHRTTANCTAVPAPFVARDCGDEAELIFGPKEYASSNNSGAAENTGFSSRNRSQPEWCESNGDALSSRRFT